MFRRIVHCPQGELFVTCSKSSAYCNVPTLVKKRKIYFTYDLHRCLKMFTYFTIQYAPANGTLTCSCVRFEQ